MFYSFEVCYHEGTEDEWWCPITLNNNAQLEGFFSIPARIRRFKVWGEES